MASEMCKGFRGTCYRWSWHASRHVSDARRKVAEGDVWWCDLTDRRIPNEAITVRLAHQIL